MSTNVRQSMHSGESFQSLVAQAINNAIKDMRDFMKNVISKDDIDYENEYCINFISEKIKYLSCKYS